MSDSMSSDPLPPREPIFNLPLVIIVSCAVLLGVHAVRALVGVETDNRIVVELAFVPARLSLALHLFPDRLSAAYQALVDKNPIVAAQLDFLIGEGHAHWWTLVTYSLLHASWPHVGFNCIWLVAFGSAVARRFSNGRFVLLLMVCAIAGAIVQYAADVTSFQIVLGASAAVSGAMGAAIRFVFRPADEPATMFDRTRINEAFRLPALSLRETFTTKASLTFVAVWFVTNFLFGYFPALSGVADGPVAWQAHIGGFLAGLLLFPLFDPRRRAPQTGDDDHEISADLPADPESERA